MSAIYFEFHDDSNAVVEIAVAALAHDLRTRAMGKLPLVIAETDGQGNGRVVIPLDVDAKHLDIAGALIPRYTTHAASADKLTIAWIEKMVPRILDYLEDARETLASRGPSTTYDIQGGVK